MYFRQKLTEDNVDYFKDMKKRIQSVFEQVSIIESFIYRISEHGKYITKSQDKKFIPVRDFLTSILKNASSFSRSMKVFDTIHFEEATDFDKVYLHFCSNDMTRMLMNIFKNAAEASLKSLKSSSEDPDYSPELRLKCLKSKSESTAMILHDHIIGPFGCQRKESPFYLIVEDNGPGISEDKKSKIFQYGYSTRASQNNLGLGLHITTNLATENDISIFFDSEEGEGTRMILGFPHVLLLEADKQTPDKGIVCKSCQDLYYSNETNCLYEELVKEEVNSSFSLVQKPDQYEY
jgi:signal transduction histidine kinase